MTNKLLNEKDVKILDLILKTSLEKEIVFPKDMPPLDDGPISDIREFYINDYLYYLDIIKPFEILDITFFDRVSFKIETINIISQQFYDNGGFKAIYDEQQGVINRAKDRQKKEDQKLEWDLQVSKFQAKTKWWPLIISVMSIIIAIWSFFK